jgi:methionyl-tRNA formyltransferase
MKDVRIVFMGTPEIAVESLDRIVQNRYTVSAVITSPDKPAGRGLKIHESAVKQYAVKHGLTVLQPENLSDTAFIDRVKEIAPDIIVVVAFRKIPDEILEIPKMGSFNLHASLLPQYRGAAPINWAVINGETQTGMTTFLLSNRIDAGDVLLQRTIDIPPVWNASRLHDEMKVVGADMVVETIGMLSEGRFKPLTQHEMIQDPTALKKAPKIFHEHCRINWNMPAKQIYNLIRGLSLRPGAFTELVSLEGTIYSMKILASDFTEISSENEPGKIETDNKSYIRIYALNGFIDLREVQISGKRQMLVTELLRGFKLNSRWYIK